MHAGHAEVVRLLLRAGARPGSPREHSEDKTLLHWAAALEDPSIARELVRARIDVSEKDRSDFDLLRLLRHRNAPDTAGTPLHVAIRYGRAATVMLLLEAGADVNLSVNGRTPLGEAVVQGSLALVQRLVEAGADVSFGLLQVAQQYGRHDVLCYLVASLQQLGQLSAGSAWLVLGIGLLC